MMATANIEEELTCSICLELYKDPRLLPCHHSVCKSCLVALRSKQDNDSDIWLRCPSCRQLFEAKDETHIESLPKNFTLASIVCKFRESLKGDNVFACDVCEDDKKGRAIKKCLECQANYCRVCLEHLHPKRGDLASHRLVHIMDAYPSARRLLVREPNPVSTNVSSNHVNMAIKITKVQKDGTMFADVKWVSSQAVDHYAVSYFCDPRERILQQDIVETRCRLSTLKWNSEYTVRVTAYLPNGKTSFDSTSFKTDLKVEDTKPAIMDISPRRVKMSIKVTNIQKAGIMSADVKWTAKYEPCEYEVLYYCNPDEVVVLKNIAENRCMLTNLRWDSTYTVTVTTELEDGTRVFNEKVFKTDLQVKCFPMAVSRVCNEKIALQNSHDEFKASNRIKEWTAYERLGKFSGIVITPVLTEDVQFWTMNIELSIFEEGRNNQIFLDFGIIPYYNLEHCCTLRYNRVAYSCSVIQKKGRQFHLVFNNCSISEGDSYLLPLELYQRAHFCYGFLYDFLNDQFAVVDCLSQTVLHVFDVAEFCSYYRPIFAVCPYHTELKMRVKIKLDRGHATNEDVSSWMQKISNF